MSLPNDDHRRLTLGARIVLLFLASLLFLMAVLSIAGGTEAIQRQKYEFRWRTGRGIGPFGWQESGTTTYHGWEAIRNGIGLVAIGAMFFTWAIGLLLWTLKSSGGRAFPGHVGIALTCVSLVSLLVACGSFFPPWRPWCLGFYSVIVLVSWVIGVGWRSETPSRWSRFVFPLWIGSAFAVSWIWADVSTGIVVGLVAVIAGWAHLGILVPSLRRRFEDSK